MQELIRSNDPILLSWIKVLLRDGGIVSVEFDTHTSLVEGSIGALPRRIMVHDKDYQEAKKVLIDAGIL